MKKHMGEDTIGVKTYEKIFELLLRLKANYIWPAMHVNSFNVKRGKRGAGGPDGDRGRNLPLRHADALQ